MRDGEIQITDKIIQVRNFFATDFCITDPINSIREMIERWMNDIAVYHANCNIRWL